MKKLPLFLFIAAIAFVVYIMLFWKDGSITIPLKKKAKSNITKDTGIADFDHIEIDGAFQVDVSYGSKERIEIDAPSHIKKRIKAKVKSKKLYFELNKRNSLYAAGKVKVHITTKKLNGFHLSGASSIQLNNPLKDESFSIHSSGATSFSGDLYVQHAQIKLEGAAKVNIAGKAEKAEVELSGASKLNDYNFEAVALNVNLSGASKVRISGVNTIEGSLSGASKLDYKGQPSVKVLEVSGAAKLNQLN